MYNKQRRQDYERRTSIRIFFESIWNEETNYEAVKLNEKKLNRQLKI